MMKLTVCLSLFLASAPWAPTQDGADAPALPVPLATVECEEMAEVPPGQALRG